MGHDFHYAFRMLIKRPMFSLSVVFTLGIAIGAVTTVFSAVDAAILKPLPYPEPDHLGQLMGFSKYRGATYVQENQDGRTWQTFKNAASAFELSAHSGAIGVGFGSGNQVSYVRLQRVTAGFFKVFSIQPILGREFNAEEDRAGGPPVVVISHDLWKNAFRSDPHIIGQTALIAGERYQIDGVAAPGFRTNENADVWTPLHPSTTGEGSGTNYTVLARLHSGVSWMQAQAEARAIGESLFQRRQLSDGSTRYFGFTPLQDSLTANLRTPLLLILGVTLLVLLIGCTNVASMLLARGAARTSEMATRMALGAGRGAVVRQLLVENIILGLAAALLGVGVAYAGTEALKHQQLDWTLLQRTAVDSRTLFAAAAVSIAATLLFGIFPVIQAGRLDIRSAQSGRGIPGGTRSIVRRVLPAFQVGIAAFLLIGAALLIESFAHLWNLEPGIDTRNVIAAGFSMRDARYDKPEMAGRLFNEVLNRLHAVPGVESAAVALSLPYERGINLVVRKPSDPPGSPARLTNVIYVSPEFFKTLRIPVMHGRAFTDADALSAPLVMVVNDAFVRMHFRNEDPIGVNLEMNGQTREIVGVVGNVQQQAGWGEYGPMGQVPSAYIPAGQASAGYLAFHVWHSPSWIVRTQGAQVNLQQEIQDAVRAVEPMLPIASFQSLEDVKATAFAWNRFLALSLGLGAAIALLLSIVGTYAMISNSVVERTREFGIRMALGATLLQTIRTAARPGIVCALVGLVAGIAAARAENKLLQGLIYGVTTTDMRTFLVVPLTVLVIAMIASVLPALRIVRVDPVQTLRHE
jgi:predicted permease